MTASLLLFYSFSAIAILGALAVILHPKPTRGVLSLIVAMFSLAVLYLLLGAPFLAMIHLIVYAGAVLVLFLFVIMLQGVGASDIPLFERFGSWHLAAALAVGGGFLTVVFLLLRPLRFAPLPLAGPAFGSVEAVGLALFKDYLLPFELISLLLLIGLFAAIALARKEDS